MHWLGNRLTYANVISTLCLILLVGGGSAFAASRFGKETIGGRAIKKESIGPGKLTKAAKATLVGPQGPAGTARAYGWTADNAGTLFAAKSKNATVRHAAKGVYCVQPGADIDASTATLLVSPDFGGSGASSMVAQVRSSNPSPDCNAGELVVRLWKDAAAAGNTEAIDAQFSFLIP